MCPTVCVISLWGHQTQMNGGREFDEGRYDCVGGEGWSRSSFVATLE